MAGGVSEHTFDIVKAVKVVTVEVMLKRYTRNMAGKHKQMI